MTLPIFSASDDPGPSFAELLRRTRPTDALPQAQHDLAITHGTTVLGVRYADGVVMAGDRRATSGNLISHKSMEKVFPAEAPYSPYAGRSYPVRPYFGDTHVHTSFSMDAGAFGARLDPRDAYRFARGEEVTASSGQPVKLSRPLDFLVVADHSDNMGFFPDLFAGKPAILADATGKRSDVSAAGEGEKLSGDSTATDSTETVARWWGSTSLRRKSSTRSAVSRGASTSSRTRGSRRVGPSASCVRPAPVQSVTV